jgi:phosphohistidine phosphatase
MEIYFLRHGDAGAAEGWKGPDAERPLSAEGTARMQREADAIARLRPGVDLILTSPLVRARQTAQIVAQALHKEGALSPDDRLAPGFHARALARILEEHAGRAGLMLVGHEPDFSSVIAACTGGGRIECKKGSLIRVDITGPSLAGILVWLLPPRVLAPPQLP